MYFIGTLSILILSNILLASNKETDINFIENSIIFYTNPKDFTFIPEGFDWINANRVDLNFSPSNVLDMNQNTFSELTNNVSSLATFFNDGDKGTPDSFGITETSSTLMNYLKSDIEGFLREKGVFLSNAHLLKFCVSSHQGICLMVVNGISILIDRSMYNKVLQYNKLVDNFEYKEFSCLNEKEILDKILSIEEEIRLINNQLDTCFQQAHEKTTQIKEKKEILKKMINDFNHCKTVKEKKELLVLIASIQSDIKQLKK